MRISDTNHLNLFTYLDNTTLNTTGYNRTATRDGEYVFNWHQERLVNRAHWLRDVSIQSFYQLLNRGSTQLVVVLPSSAISAEPQ